MAHDLRTRRNILQVAGTRGVGLVGAKSLNNLAEVQFEQKELGNPLHSPRAAVLQVLVDADEKPALPSELKA